MSRYKALRRRVARLIGRPRRPGTGAKPRRAQARDDVVATLPVGGVGAEIGVHKGDFSAELLQVARPRVLHLVDPWRFEQDPLYESSLYGGAQGESQAQMDERYQSVCHRFREDVASGRVVIHRATSKDAAAAIDDDGLDWVYIDGNHLYEYVLEDLTTYIQKVRPGGLIAGDDYGEGGWWEGGVKRAVDEFLQLGTVTVVWIRGGQFLLRRR